MDSSEYNVWKWLGAEDLKPKTNQEKKLKTTLNTLQKKMQYEKLDILNLLSDKF